MVFFVLIGFALLLGLAGREPDRRTYIVIALAGVAASAWVYHSG